MPFSRSLNRNVVSSHGRAWKFRNQKLRWCRRPKPASSVPSGRNRALRVSISPTDYRFVDHVLAKMGRQRDIALNTPHWMVVPSILKQSDLVAVMAERLATMFAESHGLILRKLPFAVPPIVWTLYWHRRHDRSAPQIWFRQQVAAAFVETTGSLAGNS